MNSNLHCNASYAPRIIKSNSAIEWWQSSALVPYPAGVSIMQQRIQDIASEKSKETIWFLEHPPIITKGIRAQPSHLLNHNKFPIFETNRGGEFTYHGPGQLVIYVMINLAKRTQDIRKFVADLENWGINALKNLGVQAECKKNRVGLWVNNNREEKIAAIGVRITKWVTWHGMAINIEPDLNHFNSIIPCGISEYGVTSLKKMQVNYKNQDHVIKQFIQSCPF